MMTEHEQRIAIAEWMGWKPFKGTSIYGTCPNDTLVKELPNCPNDLNAMQSAVLAQSKQFIREFDEDLEALAIERGCCVCELLASDWATIFLRCKRDSVKSTQ